MSEIKEDKKKRYEDKNVTRVDIRIPNEVYEEIEKIAVLTNQPFTPKSKNTDNPKPIVTPVILKGLELVLMSLKDDLISQLSEGKITNTQIVNDNLEERIFSRLEKKLEALIEAKLLTSRADNITPKNKDNKIKEDINESKIEPPPENTSKDTEAITPEILIENEVIERVSSGKNNNESEYVKNLNAIEVIPEVVNEDKEVSALEVINDDTEVVNEDSSIESPPENTESKEQGLSMSKLAQRFKTNKNKGEGASKTSISTKVKKLSKEEFINWSKENDPEGKAWQLNEADKLFYPQK
ncbi:hypothetical protein ACN4EE_18055 [Geminocystis sp. CENA526]|uniref:hypothetical protein n=1 Tax=Geminocystis sp. CENA526 TaxID=1355871 RepID=UPI003D70179F